MGVLNKVIPLIAQRSGLVSIVIHALVFGGGKRRQELSRGVFLVERFVGKRKKFGVFSLLRNGLTYDGIIVS